LRTKNEKRAVAETASSSEMAIEQNVNKKIYNYGCVCVCVSKRVCVGDHCYCRYYGTLSFILYAYIYITHRSYAAVF